MTTHFLVEQLRTAYGLTPEEAQGMVRRMVATVQVDDVRSPEQSSSLYRWPFIVGGSQAGVIAEYAERMLWNPPGSGMTGVIKRIQTRIEAAGTVTLRHHDAVTGFTLAAVPIADFRVAQAPRSSPLLQGPRSGLRVGTWIGEVASEVTALWHDCTVILRPGSGLVLEAGALDTDLFGGYMGWMEPEQERPAP